MSYTPDEQLLDNPLFKLTQAIEEVRAAIKARRLDPDQWKKEHLEELVELDRELDDLFWRVKDLQR